MYGQRNYAILQHVSYRQVQAGSAIFFQHVLFVTGHRVVNHTWYIAFGQFQLQCIAVHSFHLQGILMENVVSIWRTVRDNYFRIVFKSIVVIVGGGAARIAIRIKVAELNAKYGSLNAVQAAVAAHHFVIISFILAMVGNHSQGSSQFIVISEYRTTIAITAEVFGREEGGTTNDAH